MNALIAAFVLAAVLITSAISGVFGMAGGFGMLGLAHGQSDHGFVRRRRNAGDKLGKLLKRVGLEARQFGIHVTMSVFNKNAIIR